MLWLASRLHFGRNGPGGRAVMNGFKPTKTANATMAVTIAPPAMASLRPSSRPGAIRVSAVQAAMIISPRKPLNLESTARPAQAPARQGSRNATEPNLPDQMRCHHHRNDRQRGQRERFARNVGHGSVGEKAIERIEHENKRGDDSDSPIFDQNATCKDRHAAERTHKEDGQASDRQRQRSAEMAVVVVPRPRCGRPGHGEPSQSKGEPDQILGQGRQVVRGKVEPGKIVETAAEEQVGVIALSDVGVFVFEVARRTIPRQRRPGQRRRSPPPSRTSDRKVCGESAGRERWWDGVIPMSEEGP